MPKVKTETNAKAKTSAKDTPKGKEAAEKAARLKIQEAVAKTLAPMVAAQKAHADKASNSQKELCVAFIDAIAENAFSQDEARGAMKTAVAKVYTNGVESEVSNSGNSTANSFLSRVMRVAFPVGYPEKKAAHKEAMLCLDSPERTFSQVVSAARGDLTFKGSQPVGKHGGKRIAGKGKANAPYDTAEAFQDGIAPHLSRAWNGDGKVDNHEGGLTIDEIEDSLAELIAGYREKIEKAASGKKSGKKGAKDADADESGE